MKALSHENISRLFWLGRYSERVYTTLRNFAGRFDAMIDDEKNSHDFARIYCFDENNPDSVYSALMRAYDNAIELREEIGSDTFSYVQLAVYEMNRAKLSEAPLLQLQKVIDNIAAFWGVADDIIEDENVRSIIKLGKRIERVDLYARFGAGNEDMRRFSNIADAVMFTREKTEDIARRIAEEYGDMISIEAVFRNAGACQKIHQQRT